jgi:hypothetical protein
MGLWEEVAEEVSQVRIIRGERIRGGDARI